MGFIDIVIILMFSKNKSNLSNTRVILNFQEKNLNFQEKNLNICFHSFKHEENSDYSLGGWFWIADRNEYPMIPRVAALFFLCLLAPLVCHVARRGLKPRMNNNHHRTSDVWCRFITQVNSTFLLGAP